MGFMANAATKLKAPFPWFGGKSRVAHLVWERFGDVGNYVEPFAGSLAVLLGRPTPPRVETVNDLDCYLANFWRALRSDPEGTALLADWPVNEADLHARHRWLHRQTDFRERMRNDPEYFDAKIAAWWVWGLSCWIGDNWCRPGDQNSTPNLHRSQGIQTPALSGAGDGSGGGYGRGVHQKKLHGDGNGLDARRPALGNGGNGVHSKIDIKRPLLGGRNRKDDHGNGIHAVVGRCSHKTQLSGSGGGVGVHSKRANVLVSYFQALSDRLRRVRVCCGDWKRVLKPSVTTGHGLTGVMLDPPYGVEDRDKVYNHDSLSVATDVLQWCRENGRNERLRIALCGYDGEHNELEKLGWEKIAWKAAGGYGNQGTGNENAKRERIWFSPGCLSAGLF